MKEKNLFDILGNAEDDSMERLTDKCPEITDAQLDKILAMSERKYKMKKKEIERTKKDNNIQMTENDEVGGVEHGRRPAWFAPMCTAASLILVAGIAIGSTVLLRNGKGSINDGGVINPAATVTTTDVSGTTVTATGEGTATTVSGQTNKNGSTNKNGTASTTVVTVVSQANGANKNSGGSNATGGNSSGIASAGSSSDTMSVRDFAGTWQYQSAVDSHVEVASKDNGTVVIKDDGTYSYTDASGYTSTGTVKVGYEELGGSKTIRVSFYIGSEFKFGGYYLPDRPYEIHLGNGSVSRLVRGDDVIKNCEYQNIAYDLIERYYKVLPTVQFRFNQYTNLNDSVTFRIMNPYLGGQIEEVTFARITGKGLEINSQEDIVAYKRTVGTERFINKYRGERIVNISSSYNSGDYIDETGVVADDLLYYQAFIMYKGNMYANTVTPQMGWIGHNPPHDPTVITDVTSNSFRAYYENIMGDNNYGCDIVDFVLDPIYGEWRIDEITNENYPVYQQKAAEFGY